MEIDPIVTNGDPVLRNNAPEVPKAMFKTDELANIIARMSNSLRTTKYGVAIAAPQIGISYRIFVVSGFVITGNQRNLEDPDVAFINPSLLKISKEKTFEEEGCLSVPDVYGQVLRSHKAKVRAYTLDDKRFVRGGSGLLAQIFQHEMDHLDGTLFIDKAINVRNSEPPKEHDEKNNE